MAFIKEWLKEEDWELYNSFELYYDHKLKKANENRLWTVDKERDIYFIFLGGGGLDVPEEHAIIWQNRKIRIMSDTKAVTEKTSGKTFLHWAVTNIWAEKSLEKKESELIQLIREILSWGCENLVIDQMAEPVFVEEGRVF